MNPKHVHVLSMLYAPFMSLGQIARMIRAVNKWQEKHRSDSMLVYLLCAYRDELVTGSCTPDHVAAYTSQNVRDNIPSLVKALQEFFTSDDESLLNGLLSKVDFIGRDWRNIEMIDTEGIRDSDELKSQEHDTTFDHFRITTGLATWLALENKNKIDADGSNSALAELVLSDRNHKDPLWIMANSTLVAFRRWRNSLYGTPHLSDIFHIGHYIIEMVTIELQKQRPTFDVSMSFAVPHLDCGCVFIKPTGAESYQGFMIGFMGAVDCVTSCPTENVEDPAELDELLAKTGSDNEFCHDLGDRNINLLVDSLVIHILTQLGVSE